MGYNIRKNWVESATLLIKRPIVIIPFAIMAFLEYIALELIYFSPRKPLAYIAGPIIKKFFGEAFNHYPANLILLPRLFYYAQIVIYVVIGAALISLTVAMVSNIHRGATIKAKALINNALKNYLSFIIYACFLVGASLLLKKVEVFVFVKGMNVAGAKLPQFILDAAPFILASGLFLSGIILQVFLVGAIPIIVIDKVLVVKALWRSFLLGLRNFFSLFLLILLPFLIYYPIVLLRTGAETIISKTFPEINIIIAVVGVIITMFVECYIYICVSNFVLDKKGTRAKQ